MPRKAIRNGYRGDPRNLPPVAHWVFRHRITLIVLGLLPIVVLGLLAYHVASAALYDAVYAKHRTAALIASAVVDHVLRTATSVVEALANLESTKDATAQHDAEAMQDILRIAVDAEGGLDRSFVTSPAGLIIASYPSAPDPLITNVQFRDWFQEVVESQTTVISAVYQRRVEPRDLVFVVATPIQRDDFTLGYLVVQHLVDGLSYWLERVQAYHEGDVFVLDHRGQVAAHPHIGATAEPYVEYADIELVRRAALGRPGTGVIIDPLSRQRMIASARPLTVGPFRSWVVISEQPLAEASAPVHSVGQFLLIAGSLLAVAALLVFGAMGRTQRWLLGTETFVDSIIENLPDMIFVKEAKNLRFVRFNRAGEKLLGHSRAELLGKTDYDFFPKQQADFFVSSDRRVLASGRTLDIAEESIQTRYHGTRILHTKKVPIWEKPGRPTYLLGIAEDITERRQTESERDLLWTLSFDLLSVVDRDGHFLRVNPAFEVVLGYREAEVVGQSIFAFVHPDDHAATQQQLERLARGESVIDFENRYLQKDGEVRWLSWRTYPHDNRLYSVARDVTPLRLQLQRCHLAERSLQAATRESEQFVRLAADALAEPIRDVREYLAGLAATGAEEAAEAVQALGPIRDAVQHLERLVASLGDYVDVTGRPLPFAAVDVGEVAQRVSEEMADELRLAGATINIGTLPIIEADPEQIRRLFRYFIEHSLAYRRHEVPLHIEMSARHGKTARGPHCDVTIRDTGLPLAQRYPATAEGPVPADLDLAVCRRIIERHGGTVAVTPLADGAAYLVRLPCVQRPGPTTEAPPPAEPPPE